MISVVSDVDNTFLSRRELVCDFAGLAGKLKKLDAVDMISSEFGLGGKVVIPVKLQSQVGRLDVTGTFYVYDDESLAKRQVNPSILARLYRAKKAAEPDAAEEPGEKDG